MQDVKDVLVSPLKSSDYLKLLKVNYTQNEIAKSWDILEVHDSVAIIIYNLTRKSLVMVKQFRPAIYYNSVPNEVRKSGVIDTSKYPPSLGISLEFCAGIVDKDKSLDEIAQEEVSEECGYKVSLDSLELIMKYRSGVSPTGSLQSLYYCEVTDDMKINQGGGIDDELIDVIEMSIPEATELLKSEGPHYSPSSFLFALLWFITNKAPKLMEL